MACPWQTKTREEDYFYNQEATPVIPGWTSKVWWMADSEAYEYPYCKTDIEYFDQFVLDSHTKTFDDDYQCSLYEWRGPNYGICEPNWPGFISPTDENTPTETPVSETYFSQIEQDGEFTSITLMECPINTDLLTGYTGGVGPEHSCVYKALGACSNEETSDYCHSGADYSCPLGFKQGGTSTNVLGDCVKCDEGEYCGK